MHQLHLMTMLSHYTSQDGLIGILNSQTLRAGEFLYLNDTSEIIFGMDAVANKALQIMRGHIPQKFQVEFSNEIQQHAASEFIKSIMQGIRENGEYYKLYITSFARGRNVLEDEHGILSLWREYTGTKGYCLQYSIDKIRSLIQTEEHYYSYGLIELSEVQYGIPENDHDLIFLAEQLAILTLEQMAVTSGDYRLAEGLPDKVSTVSFMRRLLLFCGKHKNPSFDDEREIRIYALPQNQAKLAFLRPTLSKRVHTNEKGVHYISLKENIKPGLYPDRIIIGPNAELTCQQVQALCAEYEMEHMPIITKSDIPVRA